MTSEGTLLEICLMHLFGKELIKTHLYAERQPITFKPSYITLSPDFPPNVNLWLPEICSQWHGLWIIIWTDRNLVKEQNLILLTDLFILLDLVHMRLASPWSDHSSLKIK